MMDPPLRLPTLVTDGTDMVAAKTILVTNTGTVMNPNMIADTECEYALLAANAGWATNTDLIADTECEYHRVYREHLLRRQNRLDMINKADLVTEPDLVANTDSVANTALIANTAPDNLLPLWNSPEPIGIPPKVLAAIAKNHLEQWHYAQCLAPG